MRTLCLFDFDGTLTRRSTFPPFLLFAVGPLRVFWGIIRLFFVFLQLIITGEWSSQTAKIRVLKEFFQGKTQTELENLGRDFCEKILPQNLQAPVMQHLIECQKAGHTIVLVSASADIWLRHFAEKNGMTLLCTTIRYENGIFQGDLSTPICNHAEKACRIRAAFPLESFDQIIAWGNSEGDEAMFALSDWVYDFRKDSTWKKKFSIFTNN